jgi:hypothetical protein
MTTTQIVHIAMLNSFNVLTGRIEPEIIANTDIPMFAHVPDEPLKEKNLRYMIKYFEDCEMFEECAELKEIYDYRFDSLGKPREAECDCARPVILRYDYDEVRCELCKNLLIR